MSILRELLAKAVSLEASDVHIKLDQEALFRIKGDLVDSGFETVSAEDLKEIADDLVPEHLKETFETQHEVDFSYYEEDIGRFRVNVFMSQGLPTVAMRYVKPNIPTTEELNLPPQLKKLAMIPRGIVLLAGTTGCGKSTTLAALIGEINRNLRRRIVTVEDPVEYIFQDNKSFITQREVGLDTPSYDEALRHLLRQDPDIVLIGEMRDPLSIRTALLTAETGHLVFSTLHAGDASLVVPRILDTFPAKEQDPIRMALAANLQAVVCQRLVPNNQQGVVPAVEILINTPTVRKLLERNQLDVISAAVETGREDGMQTFNQSIYDFIKKGIVSEDVGMRFATNPESLRMNLRGIFLDEGKRILAT